MASAPFVSICVVTYRRPDGLQKLVRSLADLTFGPCPPRLELNVVDNDSKGSAREICDQWRRSVSFPIQYSVEQKRGIPFARNRCVEMVSPAADFAVFVDDDEMAAAGWLEELLHVQREYDADVVAGAVVPTYLVPPPRWIVEGDFHQSTRYATGTSITRAYTNNVMIRTKILRQLAPPFDEQLELTGGSDELFFRRVHQQGHKMIWADQAIVYDFVPPSRTTLRWILQRAFRYGITMPLFERKVHPERYGAARFLVKGGRWVFTGILVLPATWLFGRHVTARYLRQICFGTGIIAGALGFTYHEYRRTHGC